MTLISEDIQKAITFLENEEVVAIPTETVYGLAANAFSERAVKKIYEIKERPLYNPLILHTYSIEQVEELVAELPEKARLLAERFWPGPLSLILKKAGHIPDLITASQATVAVRIPQHPTTLKLLQSLNFPLAAPSANPFKRISPTTSRHVADYFKGRIPMVLEGGNAKSGIESTIVGFDQDQVIVYRLGSVSLEDIEQLLGEVKLVGEHENKSAAPGMLAKHYSPSTPTFLTDDLSSFIQEHKHQRIGILKFSKEAESFPVEKIKVLSPSANLTEAAANLYTALHELDALNLDLIVAERFPEEGLGKSINDRLKRATH